MMDIVTGSLRLHRGFVTRLNKTGQHSHPAQVASGDVYDGDVDWNVVVLGTSLHNHEVHES